MDDWGVEDVKQWVLNLESVNPKGNNNEAAEVRVAQKRAQAFCALRKRAMFSKRAARRPCAQILAREGVDGHRLLWLNQHHLDDDYKLPRE